MFKYLSKENKPTRAGFGNALYEIGKNNENIVALCADLTSSLNMDAFATSFPDRFFQCGIAEANMIGVAAGLSIGGKIPFTGTFATFATGRVYDQIRQSIAYSNKNVKICASHAGLSLGEDGATHQTMEDIGLMKMLPNMTVINPADFNQTKSATIAISNYFGPVYLRFGRPSVPNFTPENQDFVIGKAITFISGTDVSIFATGHMLWKALKAAEILEQKNIFAEIINIHTIKPLDNNAILQSVLKTKCVVTAEEHLKNGGLGDSIAQLLSQHFPAPQVFVALDDKFGESGKPDELLEKFHLDVPDIVEAAIQSVAMKSK